MNKFRTLFAMLIALCVVAISVGYAQDAPPVPRTEAPADQEKKQDRESDPEATKPSESKSDSAKSEEKPSAKESASNQDEEKSDEKSKDDQEKSNDDIEKKAKQDEEKSDDKKDADSDDKKADDQKADGKKADGKKADDKKADEKKADEKKADEKKADEKKADEKKDDKKSDDDEADEKPTRPSLFRLSREQERVSKFSKQSESFVEMFGPIAASVDQSTIAVVSGKRQIALGTVVDSNGLILTKASELKGSLGCRLGDGTIKEARVIGIDPETDLALLKIDAENLNVAQWSDEPAPVTGRWVVTPKAVQDRDKNFSPTVGVVSVDNRIIPPSRPFIGIQMDEVEGGGVRITQVIPRSPADFADLWVNDVIKAIDDVEVPNRISLQDTLKNYDINDRITLSIERGEKKMKLRLTLAERDKVSPDNQRANLQNSMGSILSRRRKDFPLAFQHDSMLSSKTCGGPIIDLSGKIVGINIARAGRVSSLALPTDLVLEKIEKLKTGDFAPEVVNKEAIETITAELLDMDAKFSNLPGKKAVLERKYNVEKARMEELNKTMSDLRERLKVIEAKSKSFNTELKSVRDQLRNSEKNRQRLEADREQLRTGSR